MTWKFTISYNLGSLVIDEPRGWDGINLHLKRDTTWHGFFDFIDDSMASLEFLGDAQVLLRQLYDLKGVAAEATLTVLSGR